MATVRHRTADDDGRGSAAQLLRPSRRLREDPFLARRADLAESLDGGVLEPAELERNLDDLARLGQLPGGLSASLAAISRIVRAGADPAILDVGAGRGEMALAFARRGWRTVAVDTHPQVLAAARAATDREPRIDVVEADGRSLPYPDDAFDVSHCSLMLHHLDPGDAVAVLSEMARVARDGVVVNDLRRGLLPYVATGVAVALLGRCRTTRVDGLTSVRRAYTLPELDELLSAAGLEVVWRSNRIMPRVVTAAIPRGGR